MTMINGMFECLYCGAEFRHADGLMWHLDHSPRCSNAEYASELRERRFATDPVERQRAGNRRAEDRGTK